MIKFMQDKTPSEKIVLKHLFEYAETSSEHADDISFGESLYVMVDHICEYGFKSYDYQEFAKKCPEFNMTIDQATAYHKFPSIVRSLFGQNS